MAAVLRKRRLEALRATRRGKVPTAAHDMTPATQPSSLLLQRLRRLVQQGLPPAPGSSADLSLAEARRLRLLSANRRYRQWQCLVATAPVGSSHQVVVGYAIVSVCQPQALLRPPLPSRAPLRAHVDGLVVDEAYRRRGVARQLLGAAEMLGEYPEGPLVCMRLRSLGGLCAHPLLGGPVLLCLYRISPLSATYRDAEIIPACFNARPLLPSTRVAPCAIQWGACHRQPPAGATTHCGFT